MSDHQAPTPPALEHAVVARYDGLAAAPASLSCGPALDLAALRPGERLVDLGCGRGHDLVRAAALVGEAGSVVGVDATARMVEAARRQTSALPQVRVLEGDLAAVPLPDGCADAVISNCAINHARDKAAVFREISRLLAPGGRLVVSDVVSERPLPEAVRGDPAAWAACYGGAIPEAEYLAAIAAAGLTGVDVLRRTAPYEKGGVLVLSLTVAARRPAPTLEPWMQLSRHAILADVPGRDEVLLVQPLSGQAALLPRASAEALRAGQLPASLPPATLLEAGFLVRSPAEDQALLDGALAAWRAEVALTQTQLIVVPSFGCNLACTYCYQELFDPAGAGLISPEAIEALFAYVDRHHLGGPVRPYLTLFGGEPLRDTPAHRDRIGRLLEGAAARRLQVAAVTNGHDLEAFVPLLSTGTVKEVQVTLDGPRLLHDARRPHKDGGGTFDRIVAGVDALVAAGVPVNLRVVADKENLPHLPELAAFTAARGWLDLPAGRFKTQLGRNYELFGCASRQDAGALFDRVELWARYLELCEAHPVLRRFHAPRFHGLAHLAATGELPPANFDACPATKTEWAFSPDGGVFGCTATVGHQAHRLGTFFPEVTRDEGAIARWSGRSALTIPACQGCSLAAVCGGGCGAVAWSRTGTPLETDCRPVRELYGLGTRFYRLGEPA
jgi:uncharacterized protein